MVIANRRGMRTPRRSLAPPLLVLLAVAGCGGGGATPPTAEPCTGFDTERELIALALDAERVYWADVGPNPGEGAIHAAAKACGARTTLARDQVNPRAVAVDGTHVYWVGDEGLARVAKGGGAVEKLADLILTDFDADLVVDGDDVFVATGSEILRVPRSGGTPAVLAEDLCIAVSVAVAGDQVYFSDHGCSGDVRRVSRAGGKVEVLATGQYGRGVAVDEEDVYWIGVEGAVIAAPRAGGDGRIIGGARDDSRLFLQGSHVYFTSARTITSADKDTGAWVDMRLADDAWQVVADAESVYWISETGLHRRDVPTNHAGGITTGDGSIAVSWRIDRQASCPPGTMVSLAGYGPTPRIASVPCDDLEHTLTGLSPGSYRIHLEVHGPAADSVGFDGLPITVGEGLTTFPGPVDLGACSFGGCGTKAIGCVSDGVCTPEDDCTCADCAADFYCNPGSGACPNDGVCEPYYEGCACPDCQDKPVCGP